MPLAGFRDFVTFTTLQTLSIKFIILFGTCLGQKPGWDKKRAFPGRSRNIMPAFTPKKLSALTKDDAGQSLGDGDSLFGKVRFARGRVVVHWEFRYRSPVGEKPHRAISCGTYPDTPIAIIRKQRDAYREEVRAGVDPLARIAAEKSVEKAKVELMEAEATGTLATAAAIKARITVREYFDQWAKLNLEKHKDGGTYARRAFEKDVLPEIGDLAMADVRKGHVTAMLNKVRSRGAERVAGVVFSLVRQMFRAAVDADILEADPAGTLKKGNFGSSGNERDRVLSEAEIKELTTKLPAAKFSLATEAAIWLMLSTCCRVGELLKSEWAHVDLEKRTWLIPAANAKNGEALTVQLSDFAIEQFKALQTVQSSIQWIYPARDDPDREGETHVNEKTITKQIKDRQRMTPLKGRMKCSGVLLLSGGEWKPHDLRRTGATLMGTLGVDGDVIERCLNHTEQNKMKRVYKRQGYEVEMRDAWRLLGERLELLKNGAKNVITMRKGKKKAAA
ncbi:MAG: tyrosine-type recombinase/integrase [Proteobacteria bacterium]|nr:tyrosine-type recombinase/integrase [Pseudomonadota bacterium]